jgi:formate dehydrogenase iron-sulfur subunit
MTRLKTNLYDVSKCTACRGCFTACKDSNQLPAVIEPFKGNYDTHGGDTNGNTYMVIRFNEDYDEVTGVRWNFLKYQCMHCIDPECMKVCPKGAYTKLDWGATFHDEEKCIGCQYCTYACPFGIPKYRKRTDTVTKCTLCYERVAEGLTPACTRTCAPGALKFGYRDELLEEARERVKFLRANGFPRATIYGETELGTGTNKLYILTDTPDKFGLPVNPKVSANTWVWQDWIQPYAGWLIPLALAGSATSFVTTRLLANKNKDHAEGGHE